MQSCIVSDLWIWFLTETSHSRFLDYIVWFSKNLHFQVKGVFLIFEPVFPYLATHTQPNKCHTHPHPAKKGHPPTPIQKKVKPAHTQPKKGNTHPCPAKKSHKHPHPTTKWSHPTIKRSHPTTHNWKKMSRVKHMIYTWKVFLCHNITISRCLHFWKNIDLFIFFYWFIWIYCLFFSFQQLGNYLSENSKVKVKNVWNILVFFHYGLLLLYKIIKHIMHSSQSSTCESKNNTK